MNGMTDSDAAPRLYLDANAFLYAIQGNADIADPLRQLFDLFRAGRGIGVTSELTLAEVLPKASDVQRRSYLNMIVWSRIFELRPVSRDILIETAEYREYAGMPKLSGCHPCCNRYSRRLSEGSFCRLEAEIA